MPKPTTIPPFVLALLATLLTLGVLTGCASPKPVVTILTQNLYMGFDALALLERPTPPNVEAAFAQVAASDFAARAAALAEEIAEQPPDLIALQEAVLFRTQEPGDLLRGNFAPNATAVAYDFVAILTDALAARGLTYTLAGVVTNVDIEMPGAGRDIRLTDRDVILARSGPGSRGLRVSNVRAESYAASFAAPGALSAIPIARGWVSVDVEIDGATFRFVTTTLESLEVYAGIAPEVQAAQAVELLAGPLAGELPVVFAGDVGSAAAGSGFATPSYGRLIEAGLADAWAAARPDADGFTCCRAPSLDEERSSLDVRLDVVLVRGGFTVADARLVGDAPRAITGAVRWPSDHAGVLVRLELP